MRRRLFILLTLAHASAAAPGDAIPAPGAAAPASVAVAGNVNRDGQSSHSAPSSRTDRPVHADPLEPRYVASREIVFAYAVDAAAPVDAVELWFRRTSDQPWAPVEFQATHPGALTYKAPDDGPYDFYLILRNAGGASAPPPTATSAPHARVLVDTVPPVVQIHRAQVRSLAAMDRRLSVDLTAADEHLGPAGVRLFYRPAGTEPTVSMPPDSTEPSERMKSPSLTEPPERTESPDSAETSTEQGTGLRTVSSAGMERGTGLRPVFHPETGVARWRDGGAVEAKDGGFKWPLPDDLPDTLDVRIVVTDLAGNQAVDELRYVPTVLVSPNGESAPTAELEQMARAEPTDDGRVAHVDRVEVPPVTPVGAAGEPPSTETPLDSTQAAGRDPAPDSPDAAAKAASEEARRMAEIAARHLRAREYDLAAARFRDGLKLVPNDPDLLTGLGGVLYRMEQFDGAAAQFASALLTEPDHVGALEGYALVDATQRRYPDARKRLGQLLRLQPRSARHWLHFGDIEHKLGNTREALEAWRKAVDLENAPPEIVEQGRKRLKYFDNSRP